MPADAVVFDLDGVLVDSEPVWEQVRRAVVAEHGGHWADDAQTRLMGMSTPEWAAYLADDLGVGMPPAEVAALVLDRMAQRYAEDGVPLVILAGKEYGSGSSRDWAAKGTALLGAKAVITESFERIHRSNLIGMGVLPLQYPEGENAESLGLTGEETFDITGVTALNDGEIPRTVHVKATSPDGAEKEFDAVVRIDTPGEADYYRNGGILQYVLRSLLAS